MAEDFDGPSTRCGSLALPYDPDRDRASGCTPRPGGTVTYELATTHPGSIGTAVSLVFGDVSAQVSLQDDAGDGSGACHASRCRYVRAREEI